MSVTIPTDQTSAQHFAPITELRSETEWSAPCKCNNGTNNPPERDANASVSTVFLQFEFGTESQIETPSELNPGQGFYAPSIL